MGQTEAVNKRKKCMMAMGKGHRRCLGVNVANAGMCLILSAAAGFEMELWETGSRDAEVVADYFIPAGHEDSKGVRVVFK